MKYYNDLSLNNSILDKMLIIPWNFNYHNDSNTWIFIFNSFRKLTLSLQTVQCNMAGLRNPELPSDVI